MFLRSYKSAYLLALLSLFGTTAQAAAPAPLLIPGADDPSPEFVISPEDLLSPEPTWGEMDGPLFIALFGDSVSLATMADEKIGNPGPRFYADFIGSGLASILSETVAAKLKHESSEDEKHILLGKLFGNMARKRLSPYLGTQDYSLPVLLREKTGFTPKVYNGAQMAGAYHFGHIYLDRFQKFIERNPFHKRPDLIIVNFNGMDFMGNWGAEAYQTKVREFYQRLTSMAPFAKIVATGISDPVPLLTYPDRIAVKRSPTGPIYCSTLYKLVKFGNESGLKPGASQATIDTARAHILRLRNILSNEVSAMNQDQSLYPHFKGTAVYVDPTQKDQGISPDMIAADCIHPNSEAQRFIGQQMWNIIESVL